MGDKTSHNLPESRSCYEPHISRHLPPSGHCKSEFSVTSPKHRKPTKRENMVKNLKFLEEYYKKYEHDEVPVKDSNLTIDTDVGDRPSLTNSDLDKLELKVLKNMSQELTTDNISSISLESNIKFLKTTVQEIFDNFYACMRDFEVYKKRFHDLGKNDKDAVADMEEIIKDMIQHIMSSDISLNDGKASDSSKKTFSIESDDNLFGDEEEESIISEEKVASDCLSDSGIEKPVVETCTKNEYVDATKNESADLKPDEVFNIFLVGGYPSLQINMNDRNLLSELNIKEPKSNVVSNYVASAENMLKVAAKKMEVANYQEQREQRCGDCPDRDIPVKISYAKKNIHLNEDFSHERDSDRSIFAKICNFLCRKFRKL